MGVLIESEGGRSGYVMVYCSRCAAQFEVPVMKLNQLRRQKRRRLYCRPTCRFAQPRQDLTAWARIDMKAGLSWYESAQKRKVAKSTMRKVYARLGWQPDGTQRKSRLAQ